jgi:omega-6 fatty acid desaturase (delta-12 desaturase)
VSEHHAPCHVRPDRAAAPWAKTLSEHKTPSALKSGWQVVNSFVPFVGLWFLMYLATFWSYWLTLALAIPAAGFLVRIFIIQHDCGHHAFLPHRRANDVLGYLCGFLTLTPYHLWRRNHARHHSCSGDLHHRGHGDVGTLTVDEYLARTRVGRIKYRLYRHPLVMFLFGASYLFLVRQRFTFGLPRTWHRERRSVYLTNLGLAAMIAIGWYAIGLPSFLMIHLPIIVIGAAIGSWLFFVQHQYEETYWQPHPTWDFTRSALEGSSYYRLPRVLQWFTGNIGFHHIHHLDSRIPNYNLNACYDAEPALQEAATLGIRDSLKCISMKLWDERRQRMVTFAEV